MVVQHGDRTLSPGLLSILPAQIVNRPSGLYPHQTTRRRIRYRSRHWKTFKRDDGRAQKYHIMGKDEADPKAGSISFVSPVARLLMGKAVGDVVGTPGQELEIISI